MHIDYFWLVNLWLLSFLVAMMLYLKWTTPILDRWNNLLRRSKSFVLLSAAVFFISLGMFFCKFYVYEQPSNKTEYVKQKARILNDDFLPISCGLAFRTFNEYLVVPGQHTFHFEVKESRFKGGDNVLFTQHMDLDLAPNSMYIIKREGKEGKLTYNFKCKRPETNNNIL